MTGNTVFYKKYSNTKHISSRWYLVTAAVIFVSLMTGCGSSTDPDDQLIPRTTDIVRLYQSGDFIDYTVTGSVTDTRFVRTGGNEFIYPNADLGSCEPTRVLPSAPEDLTGDLKVEWFSVNPGLQLPPGTAVGGVEANALREISTLNLYDSLSTRVGGGTSTRYILQDQNTGEVSVLAFDDTAVSSDYFWTSTARSQVTRDQQYTNGTFVLDEQNNRIEETVDIANLSRISSPVVLESPVPLFTDTSVDFYIHSGCDGVTVCPEELRHYTESLSYIGDDRRGLTTYFGRIDPLGYQFHGDIKDTSTTRTSETELFDIRAFCSAGGNGIASFNGSAWILPEMGVVGFSNVSCASPVTTWVERVELFPAPNDGREDVTCAIDPTFDPNFNVTAATAEFDGRVRAITEGRNWVWSAEIVATNIPEPI